VELAGYEKEIGQQQSCIARLERERDNYSHEALKLAHQVAIRLEEVKKLDMSIYEYRKKLGEIEGQLKKIQQIYETAVYDRQLLHRTLRDTQVRRLVTFCNKYNDVKPNS
jgi:chromosome segregation ATPase